jgi:hypothetical protein
VLLLPPLLGVRSLLGDRHPWQPESRPIQARRDRRSKAEGRWGIEAMAAFREAGAVVDNSDLAGLSIYFEVSIAELL